MTTEVSISNLALSHLGDEATVTAINPPENSVQAERCGLFYPIARDTLLAMYQWNFATTRATPVLLELAYTSWAYAYALPSDFLEMISVLPSGYINDGDDSVEFDIESDAAGGLILLTNIETPTIRYKRRVTNPARFPPLFVEALAWILASSLAGPTLKGDEGQKAAVNCWSNGISIASRASVVSANQSKTRVEHTPPWIAARA